MANTIDPGAMNRRDFFYGQAVQHTELDDAFQDVDDRFQSEKTDHGSFGVVANPYATPPAELLIYEQTVPSMTVECSVGKCITATGKRAERKSLTPSLDCSVDKDGVSVIPSAGNTRYISIFILPEFQDLDPREDWNEDQVYFEKQVNHKFEVVAGAEAGLGSAVKPSLRTDAVLLADVLILDSTTSITNAVSPTAPGPGEIDLTRKETYTERRKIVRVDDYLKMMANSPAGVVDSYQQMYRDHGVIGYVSFDGTSGGVGDEMTMKTRSNVLKVVKFTSGGGGETFKVHIPGDLFSSINNAFGMVQSNVAHAAAPQVTPLSLSSDPPDGVFIISVDATADHISFLIFGKPNI